MGPQSYIRPVVDRNVIMRSMTVQDARYIRKKIGNSLVFCTPKYHTVVEMPVSFYEIRPKLSRPFRGQHI